MIYRYKWEVKLWIAVIAYIVWVITASMAHGQPVLHGMSNDNGSLYDVSMKICFATPELMAKFFEQNPKEEFNVTVPCPPEPKHLPEDESGK